jgi:hypothetical protein
LRLRPALVYLSRSQTSTNHKLLTLYYSSSVVVVWYPVRQFVSPSRQFVCDSHTNSHTIQILSATNQQPTNVFINNRATLSSRALQGDSNAAEIIANGLVVTATFCLLYYRQDSKYSARAINHHQFLTFDLLTR